MSDPLPNIAWPVRVLDFEASCLPQGGYPIEVGIATWDSPEADICTWSSLIKPTKEWVRYGLWFAESQELHKIKPSSLADGLEPKRIMEILNALTPIGASYLCDGGKFDQYWLDRLIAAAEEAAEDDVTPHFSLIGWYKFCKCWKDSGGPEIVPTGDIPHRAGPDAVELIFRVAKAMGLPKPAVTKMSYATLSK